MTTDNLKLPPIPVPRGRSPGSSPDVRRRSKEREERKLRTAGLRLPRLFRGRSFSSATTYLTHSLTNLSEIVGAESSDDGGPELSPSSGQGSRKASKSQDASKWPLMKTLSGASAKLHNQHLYQSSASSTPSGRRSPKTALTQPTPTGLMAPNERKPRSQSHSHRFPFNLNMSTGGNTASASTGERQCNFKNIYDEKGNWIGFVHRKNTGDGRASRPWSNQTTFFTRARSADDVFQLSIDDLIEQ